MKRFLRYLLYREGYRAIRKVMRGSPSNSGSESGPVEPGKAIEEGRHSTDNTDGFPVDGDRIESPAQLKAALQRMDAYDFEHFIGDLWEQMGWQTDVSTAAADKGVDVTAKKTSPYEQTLLIQAKRYGPNTTVGSPEVQQYASLRHQYRGVDKVLLVTTNEYTGQAKDLAENLNVKLIDGDELVQLVLEHDALDLVANYLDFIELITPEDASQSADDTADQRTDSSETNGHSVEPETSSTQSTHTTSLDSTRWHKLVMGTTVGWVALFLGVLVIPDGLWAALFLTTWVALPVALVLDARQIGDVTDWPKYTWAYVLASLVWFVAVIPGVIYLWRRRSVSVTNAAESTPDEERSSSLPSPSHGDDQRSESAGESIGNTAEQPSESQSGLSDADREQAKVIGYEDERYTCRVERSPNGEWLVAYGRGSDPNDARVFVYDETGLQCTEPLTEPAAASVANSGRTVVIDALDPDEHSAKLEAFEPTGTDRFTHYFNASVADSEITADGTHAVVTTYSPDDTAYIFSLASGERRAIHDLSHEKARHLTITSEQEPTEIEFSTEPEADPVYALTLDGDVVWEATDHPGDSTAEDTDVDDPKQLREQIDSLRQAYDAAEAEPERNDVAQSLAEAHWLLANALEDEDAEAMVAHLEDAKERYLELLPWYEGKSGAAKVLRKQGAYHLDLGNEGKAADCFTQIKHLEEEYSVQLLTEEDERQLEEL